MTKAKNSKKKKVNKDRSLKQRPTRKETRRYDEETLDFHSIKGVAGSAHELVDDGELNEQ